MDLTGHAPRFAPIAAEPTAARRLRAVVLSGGILLCVLSAAFTPPPALAKTRASLTASFSPSRLGGRTTLDFSFSLSAPGSSVPPPLTQIELRYPKNLGIGLSGLGLATCSAPALEVRGPKGCPADSVMGYGVVLTGIVLGSTLIHESAPITIFRAPTRSRRIGLLFYADGTRPVSTSIVFSGLLLPAPAPFGGQVNIGVPLVPTLPGAPDISVIHLSAALGPRNVTYFEQVAGSTLAYRPEGILLPSRCPKAGFPFQARFAFSGGGSARARTTVRCPARRVRLSAGSGARPSRPSPRLPRSRLRSPPRLSQSRLAG